MKIFNITLILILFSIIGLNAQEKHVFSEKAKTAFKKMVTPESTLRWMTIEETEKVPKAEFLEKSKMIFDLDEKTAFKEMRVNKGESNWLHYRLQQTYNDIPIFGAEYLVHEKNGLVETANGNVVTGLNISTTPSISEEVALQMLLNEIGAEKYTWEDDFSEKMLKHQTQVRANCNSPQRRIQKEDQNATYFPKGELIIVSANGDFNPENFTLGYKFRIKTVQPLSHFDYIVDAFTGSVVCKNSLLCQYDVQGTCMTHRYGTQTITTDFDGVQYSLKESDRNIETYNGLGLDASDVVAEYYYDSDNIWNNANQRSACEAHWALEKTYDYFLVEHSWQGYDGNGSKFIAWVNVRSNWNNIVGGGGEIYSGEGDGINYGPFTAIDVVAHEYTHSVIQACGANLQYIGESGALNESFADIFGTLVEFYAEPNSNNKDWLLGEDVSLTGSAGAFRDMSDPRSKGHPAAYEDDNWYDTMSDCSILNDFCGVHTNSSVQNHWFYILANGKSGTNYFGYSYNVTGIGMTKAAQLAFNNLNNYLSPYSDYMDAKNGSIQAATALNFTTAEINQIEEAWCAVGLGNCTSTEVYPDDLNFDGITNYKDIIVFGLHNDESGPERAAAYQDINWSPHPSSDWGVTQENSADLKHTDADGNGLVNLDDVEAIKANYGRTHNASSVSTTSNTNSSLEVSLVANDDVPSFIGNDYNLVLDIEVEDPSGSDIPLYGFYFSIEYYDPGLLINDIEVEFPESWFGIPNQDFTYIAHYDTIDKKIDIGITKFNHQNSIGSGSIGQIITSINNETPWDPIALSFTVSDISIHSEPSSLPIEIDDAITTIIVSQPTCEPAINITSSTPLNNHAAEGLIQTTGDISINNNGDVTFGSDRFTVNEGLVVESGSEFTYYNDPCGTSNRSADSGQNIKPNQLFKSGSYKIIEDHLVFNLDLIKEGKVSFEILGNSNNTHLFEFGERDKGIQDINIPLKDLPTDKFYACLKVGADRYYFEVFL